VIMLALSAEAVPKLRLPGGKSGDSPVPVAAPIGDRPATVFPVAKRVIAPPACRLEGARLGSDVVPWPPHTRPAAGWASIDAALVEGMATVPRLGAESGSFDMRNMVWRLSWPRACGLRAGPSFAVDFRQSARLGSG
jgi:hypothetical protein